MFPERFSSSSIHLSLAFTAPAMCFLSREQNMLVHAVASRQECVIGCRTVLKMAIIQNLFRTAGGMSRWTTHGVAINDLMHFAKWSVYAKKINSFEIQIQICCSSSQVLTEFNVFSPIATALLVGSYLPCSSHVALGISAGLDCSSAGCFSSLVLCLRGFFYLFNSFALSKRNVR